MVVAQRYDRQARIEGWNQNELQKALLTIVGHNTFSEYLALSASALGIGKIRIIATPYDQNTEENILLRLSTQRSRKKRLEEMIEKVGGAKLEFINAHMKNHAEKYFLNNNSFIYVDASGRNESRATCLDKSTESARGYCELVKFSKEGFLSVNSLENPFDLGDKPEAKMDSISSMIAAGVILEEIKKTIFAKQKQRELVSYEFPQETEDGAKYSKLNALIVGAGALGNFVAPGLTTIGFTKIDIMDNDTIEETNLNRQIAFFEAVGQPKAQVLAERCMGISDKKAKYTPIIKRFRKDDDAKKYDIVFDCVDNFETRALLSKKCVEAQIPLISGGTSYIAGQAVVYSPKKTSCTNHILDLDMIAEKRREERERMERNPAAGCLAQPDPSVIMTNQITAGLMVNGARQLVYPEIFGNPVNGQSRYDSIGAQRLGKIEMKKPCGD